MRTVVLLAFLAAVSAWAPAMRATVRPAVSSRSSITNMKTYASLKEAQEAIAAEEAAAAKPAKAARAPKEPKAPREPREPRATKAPKAKAAPPAPPPPPAAPLTPAQQRSALEAQLAEIQASRKAAEEELKAAQGAASKAKAKVGGGGGGGGGGGDRKASLPSVTLPKFEAPGGGLSLPKFDLSVPTASSDASPLTGPGAYGLGAGLALGLVPAGALIGVRASARSK